MDTDIYLAEIARWILSDNYYNCLWFWLL